MARLIDLDELLKFPIRIDHYDKVNGNERFVYGVETVLEYAENLPVVDAMEMPAGRPGDYLEWDNGIGEFSFYRISAIHIDERTVRYDIGDKCPVVDHKNIVRILTPKEMKKVMSEHLDLLLPEGEKILTIRKRPNAILPYGERKDNED